MTVVRRLLFTLFLAGGLCAGAAPALEDIGQPVSFGSLMPFGVTRQGEDETVWAIVRSPEQRGWVGFNARTGKSAFIDLGKYRSHLHLARVYDNKLYAFLADSDRRQGVFLACDPADGKIAEYWLDAKAQPGYFMQISGDISADGVFYVGLYPQTQLCFLDTRTGKTGYTARLSADPQQKYLIQVVADRNGGLIYLSAGLHHHEVIAYDPATGTGRQIFADPKRKNRAGLELGGDGAVYFTSGGRHYRCAAEGAEAVAAIPPIAAGEARFYQSCDLRLSGGRRLLSINHRNQLAIAGPGRERTEVETDFPVAHPLVYSICGGAGDRIWVGSFSPAALSAFDAAATKKIEYLDYGKMSTGNVQIYWTLELGGKIFTSSYTGGCIDLVDPAAGKFRNLVKLSGKEEQERIFMLIPAADGKIYGPTMPIKAILGGGIVELDPGTLKHRFYRNVISDQSLRALAAADGKLLFGVSDIGGGTSAIPKAKTAELFLWDTESKQVVFQHAPIPGERCYLGAYPLGGNRFWTLGTATGSVVVFNAAERKVERIVKLPGRGTLRPVGSAPALENRAYLLRGDALLAVDLGTGKVSTVLTSPAIGAKFARGNLHGTHAEYLAADGTAYLGSESRLYRVRLK